MAGVLACYIVAGVRGGVVAWRALLRHFGGVADYHAYAKGGLTGDRDNFYLSCGRA